MMKLETRSYLKSITFNQQKAIDYLCAHFQPEKSGCWTWLGYKNKAGYGTACIGRYKYRAHRFAYELLVGHIQTDTLDHLCRNPSCINPDHLEPVTRGENVLRGNTIPAMRAAKTHCVRGHSLEDACVVKNHRYCKECNRIKSSHYYKTGSTKGAFDKYSKRGGEQPRP